jgi:DNA-binding MarR family transcriptional regulator
MKCIEMRDNLFLSITIQLMPSVKNTPNIQLHASTPLPDFRVLKSWLSVVRTYHQCTNTLAGILAQYDLTVPQYEVLTHLQRHPGMTQKELAGRCFAAKSGISMLLKKMETERWVKRITDEHDSRAKRLHLTALGQAQAKRSLSVQMQVVNVMGEHLTNHEIAVLTDLMQRLEQPLLDLTPSVNNKKGRGTRSSTSRPTHVGPQKR